MEYDPTFVFEEEAPLEAAPPPPPPLPRLRRIDAIVMLLLVAASATVLLARLSEPGKALPADAEDCRKYPPLSGRCHELIPLDEVHYVPDARDVIRFGTESDTRVSADDGAFIVHPPAGKMFIAAGIRAFGDRPFGWRFFGAVFGALSVAVVYLIAFRLWGSTFWAGVAALLLAVEGLWFVLARTAMLDIYAAAFLLAGMWMLLQDRDRLREGVRWWRWGAGAAFGLALASKWAVAPVVVVVVAASIAWGRHGARGGRGGRTLAAGAALVLVPLVVYIATYAPWFADSHRYLPPRCEGKGAMSGWLCYQREIYDFHRHLAKYEKGKPAHPYFGNAWSWPWIGRPVAHAYEAVSENTPEERRIEVLGLPNPVTWWLSFLAWPLLAWWTFRRRDPDAGLLFAAFGAGFVPYLAFDAIGRPVFFFYALPVMPFAVLGVVHVMHGAALRWPRARYAVLGYATIAVLVFAYLYPVLAGWPLSPGGFWGWQGRMWFTRDCGVEDAIKTLCWI